MFRVLVLALGLASVLYAAKEDPVQWTLAPVDGVSRVAPGSERYLELKASIQPGWHLYSPTTPPGGPIPTKIQLTPNPAIAAYKVFRPQPVRKLDPNFQIETETYTGDVTFLIDAITSANAAGTATIEAQMRYQVCSDVKCLPPVKKKMT